jgi:hypothetical protein
MMNQLASRLTICLLAVALVAGCGRGNGLPADLVQHLAAHGIAISPTSSHAPMSQRGGYVVAPHNAAVVTNLMATFKLEKIAPEDRRWSWALSHGGGITTAKEIWGVSGRPPQFKLKNGGQFEYFYLIITPDGRMILVAEYAYG